MKYTVKYGLQHKETGKLLEYVEYENDWSGTICLLDEYGTRQWLVDDADTVLRVKTNPEKYDTYSTYTNPCANSLELDKYEPVKITMVCERI